MSSGREKLKRELKEDKKKVVKEMHRTVSKPEATGAIFVRMCTGRVARATRSSGATQFFYLVIRVRFDHVLLTGVREGR